VANNVYDGHVGYAPPRRIYEGVTYNQKKEKMKYISLIITLLFITNLNGQKSDFFTKLEIDDPLNILLDSLKSSSIFPPSNDSIWRNGYEVIMECKAENYSKALELYKLHFNNKWSYGKATYYGLLAASEIDSLQFFYELFNSCPQAAKTNLKKNKWNEQIINSLNSQHILDSIHQVSQNKELNKELNEQLTLIFIEDQSARNPSGKVILDQWVHNQLEKDSLTHLLDKARNLPFLDLSRSHWIQLDSILSKPSEFNFDELGYLATRALNIALLHAKPSKVEKYYSFIKDNFSPTIIAYFVDKAMVERHRPQIFGSQGDTDKIRNKPTFYPIENIDRVDEFRRIVGLDPLENYAKGLNINYDVEIEFLKNQTQK
jgi:hypothetical protein